MENQMNNEATHNKEPRAVNSKTLSKVDLAKIPSEINTTENEDSLKEQDEIYLLNATNR